MDGLIGNGGDRIGSVKSVVVLCFRSFETNK